LRSSGAQWVSITLIKPSSIDTPLWHQGKYYLPKQPHKPRRILSLKPLSIPHNTLSAAWPRQINGHGGNLFPRLSDKIRESAEYYLQTKKNPTGNIDDSNL
jgi:hypothetical protein